jgi:RNA polymerase sigma-70 factor (ECF subfamily)
VFVQVYRSAPRYKPTAKFTTWLFTIVHNAVLNERRRRTRHAAESLEALAEPEDTEQPGWRMADASAADPAQEVARRELQERIQEAIGRLPDAQRTAVVLCRYEGQSYEDIAQVLKCSVSAVKSLLHRARQTLKRELRGYY